MDVNVFNENWDVFNQLFDGGGGKKSYLASIESLEDSFAESDTGGADDEELNVNINNNNKNNSANNNHQNHNHNLNINSKSNNGDNSVGSDSSSSTIDDCVQQQIHQQQQNCVQYNKDCVVQSSSAMDDGDILPNCLKLRHIERVIMEIVETERTYVQDLSEIIEGYLIYFKKFITYQGSSSTSQSSTKKSFICLDQLLNLFGNIEDIFKFNARFLSQLEECDLMPSRIAKCFVQQSKGFEVYTQYCTNYPRTVSLLTDLMTNKETSEIFRERQLFLKHSLPLGSYLLKPVQRILKYHLLLQNIVKNNEDESGDIDDIRQALSVMTNIAAHINEMKRKHEHAVRVQEIQSLLYGWQGQDLTTYGELVAEGSFRMLGAKAVRHLFLFDKMLLITKKKEDGLLSYKAHIMCSNLMVIESIEGEPFCFQTIPFDCPRTQYTFQSRNLDHKREWCLQLKRLMLENYPMPIPSNAKQIVMKLGLTSSHGSNGSGSGSGKESKSGYSSVGSGRRTPSAPGYLEKRQQDRRKSDAHSHSNSNSLHKGFKLRKSLKKIQPFDLTMINGSKRSRSASTDETAMNLLKREEQLKIDRRSSLGAIKPASLQEEEISNSQNSNISLASCDVKLSNKTMDCLIVTTSASSSPSLPSPICSTNNITKISSSIMTSSTTTLSTTTSSNSSLASLEKSLCDNIDGERSYWSGLRRSSSRCSARKLANDYLKRASISEAYGDDYVSFYFCGNGLVRRDSINGSTSSNGGVITSGNNGDDRLIGGNNCDRSTHGYGLSSGSSELSMTSMASSTPSESDSIMCICKAYRQLNLRSTPKQTQSSSSSTSSSTSSFTLSTDGNNGSNVHIVENPYDEYIPCLCGSSCEQRSRLFNSNSGEDSGLGSICSGSSSNSSFSARTSTPLSAGSSELSMTSSSHSSTDDYHHILSNLTNGVGTLGLNSDLHPSSNHPNNPHNVRRAQSFTGMVKTKTALLTHTLSFRHSPQLDFPPCCNLTHHHQYNQYHHHHHHHGNNQQQQQQHQYHHHRHHNHSHHRSQLQQNHHSSQQQHHQEEEQLTEEERQNCHSNNEHHHGNSHSDDSPDISSSFSSSSHHTPSTTSGSSQTSPSSSSSSTTTTFSSSSSSSSTPLSNVSNVSFSRNSSNVRLPSSTSLEEMSPTSPAIWLRKQEEHFPLACKKGGSLPRSFESTAFTSSTSQS